MKLRIQDNSIRFRITLQELEQLQSSGKVERTCCFPSGTQGGPSFRYALEWNPECRESYVKLAGASLALCLSEDDRKTLSLPSREGIYIRREWETSNGDVERLMVFVEKDRPSSKCVKKEAWIYEGHRGGKDVLKAIPTASND